MYVTIQTTTNRHYTAFEQDLLAHGVVRFPKGFGDRETPPITVDHSLKKIRLDNNYNGHPGVPYRFENTEGNLTLHLKHITPTLVLDEIGNEVQWKPIID